jgi:hypothetical protein
MTCKTNVSTDNCTLSMARSSRRHVKKKCGRIMYGLSQLQSDWADNGRGRMDHLGDFIGITGDKNQLLSTCSKAHPPCSGAFSGMYLIMALSSLGSYTLSQVLRV